MSFFLRVCLITIAFVGVSVGRASADSCFNASGSYTRYFLGTWIMKVDVVQNDCQIVNATYTLPDGTQFARVLLLDSTDHIVGQDGEGLIHFERNSVTRTSFELSGRSELNRVLKSSWVGRWSKGALGELIDYSEEFSPQGISQGPITSVFLRD